jgi:cohesin loading factor subunit SCC2
MDLTAATWGQELAIALRQLNLQQKESNSIQSEQIHLHARLKSALSEVWKDSSNDVFDVG